MTAKDSKSIPKKAEDALLLDLLIRVNAAAQNPGEEHADLAEQFAQVMADPATGEQLQALRAQAEADRGLREALNRIACAWTITANSLYVNGGTEFDAGKAAGLAQASESLTRTCAALAQAGGE